MTERRSINFWQTSQMLMGEQYENVQSINCPIPRNRDQSLSFFPRQQQSRNTMNFFNLQNTINFQQTSKKESGFFQKLEPFLQQPQPKIQQQIYESSQFEFSQQQNAQRKGLRYLSRLVYQAMKKKKFTSQNQIVQFVQNHFLKNCKSIKNFDKESKNIKRRLYDTLNVMLAAQILQKDSTNLTFKNGTLQIPSKNSLFEKKNRFTKQVSIRQRRINTKKEHLKKLRMKIQGLKQLITRNQQDEQVKNLEEQKIYFPIIMTRNINENKMKVEYNHEKHFIKLKSDECIQMYADLDVAGLWTQNQQQIQKNKMREERLLKTQQHSHNYSSQQNMCLEK